MTNEAYQLFEAVTNPLFYTEFVQRNGLDVINRCLAHTHTAYLPIFLNKIIRINAALREEVIKTFDFESFIKHTYMGSINKSAYGIKCVFLPLISSKECAQKMLSFQDNNIGKQTHGCPPMYIEAMQVSDRDAVRSDRDIM